MAGVFRLFEQANFAGDVDSPLTVRTLGACDDSAGLGVLTFAIGTDSLEGGDFVVSGVPTGAQIVEAWLYWNGDDDGNKANEDPGTFNPIFDNGDPTITLNGQPAPNPRIIGGPAYWSNSRYAYAYRADVQGLVTGNGVYTLAGMDNFDDGTGGFNNGAELVIIYRASGRQPTLVGIADGLDLLAGNGPSSGPGARPVVFAFEPAPYTRTAQVNIFMGGAGVSGNSSLWYELGADAPPNPSSLHLIDMPGAVEIPNPFDGLQNQNQHGYWDDYSISITVPAGSRWLAVQPESDVADPAELEWVGAIAELPLSCLSRVYAPLIMQ